jgi:hypothetical protein
LTQERREALRAAIIDEVAVGAKGVELACALAASHRCSGDELHALLAEMVAAGEVVEVEYVRPEDRAGDDARVKSFYLPGGTSVRLAA